MHKRRLLLITILLIPVLVGCSTFKEHSRRRSMLSAISTSDLKGTNKVDVIKRFGEPVATSKSEVSECWYYVKPKAIWLWFEGDIVDRWEVE